MSEPEPTAKRVPMATRVAPKTVQVRRHDITPDPSDDPIGPPRVLFWFRLSCVAVALCGLFVTSIGSFKFAFDGQESQVLPWTIVSFLVFVAYLLPLWWRRPRWWHWAYGVALMLPGVLPLTNPFSVILLVFWCMPRTVRFFRNPPASYVVVAPPPAPGTVVPIDPPGVLFAMRWMCLLGCLACLLALPIAGSLHATNPNPDWTVMWWLGGFAGAFVLFIVPLLTRTPRPWVWWYGLILLLLCSLSLYFTLLALPILAFWLAKGPRNFFAGRTTDTPVTPVAL